MTHASVFSGIGGPEVAASMLGWENLFHCEINPFGKAVLDYWYPNAKSYDDITKTDFREWRGRINVLTGGFPCQPFSYAGKRKGADDDRYLWPSMYRCIDEIRPDWVIGENVAGITTMVEQGEVSAMANQATLFDEADDVRGIYQLRETFTLQRICDDLTSHGYSVQPILIPACAVGAPHRRDRVFIIARRVNQGEDEAVLQSKRTIFDTADERPRGTADGRTTGEVRGKVREEGHHAELRVSTETSSGDGHTSDTSDARTEGMRQKRQDAVHRPESIADTDRTRCNREIMLGESEEDGHELDSDFAGHSGVAGCCRWQWGAPGEWLPTQSPIHRGNDGLPFDVDNLTIPFPKWRTEALKAYGNAIVPQVMYEIFRAIQEVENLTHL